MARVLNLTNLAQFTAVELLADPGAVGGPVVVDQCAQIVLDWLVEDGKVCHNVLYGQFQGGFAGTIAQANSILAGLTAGSPWSTLASFLAPTTTLLGVTIRNVDVRDQPLLSSTGPGSVGTSTGVALPAEVAVVATLRTQLTGRQNRGRIYIPGWATTALGAGNQIAAAAVTAVTNWAGIIAGVMNGQGYVFCIGHQARNAYVSPITGVSHPARASGGVPIITATCRDNHWDSQRRRGLR